MTFVERQKTDAETINIWSSVDWPLDFLAAAGGVHEKFKWHQSGFESLKRVRVYELKAINHD